MNQKVFNPSDADLLAFFDDITLRQIGKEIHEELKFREFVYPNQAVGNFDKERKLEVRVKVLQVIGAVFSLMSEQELQKFRARFHARVVFTQAKIELE